MTSAALSYTSCCGVKDFSNIHYGFNVNKPETWPSTVDGLFLVLAQAWRPLRMKNIYVADAGLYSPISYGKGEYVPTGCHILFTDHHSVNNDHVKRVGVPYGKILAKRILKEGLGTLVCTKQAKNPNSGNMITAWLWTIDHENLKKYLGKMSDLISEYHAQRHSFVLEYGETRQKSIAAGKPVAVLSYPKHLSSLALFPEYLEKMKQTPQVLPEPEKT